MKAFRLAFCVLVLAAGLAGRSWASQSSEPIVTVVELFNGTLVRGIILQENEREIVVRTWVGDKTVSRSEITEIRRNLTAEERSTILRGIDPGKDYADWQARDKALAGRRDVETPVVQAPPSRERPVARPEPVERPARATTESSYGAANRGTWAERTAAGLERHVSFDFEDTPLSEALHLVATVADLNIIVNPKVRSTDPRVTLNVKQMDAGTALKWITKLSGTYISVVDEALYVTDTPPKEEEDEERMEFAMLITFNKLDGSLMPPPGQPISDQERLALAQALFEKTNPKPQDFPGPSIGLVSDDDASESPFAANPFGPAR